jgi:predicted small integral membrane protein
MHEVQRNHVRVVLSFLAVTVRQSREPPHAHPHRQILPFDVTRGNVLWVWIAGAAKNFHPLDLCRAVAARRMRNLAVELHELSVIDIGTKASFDGF